MAITPVDRSNLSLTLAQFKAPLTPVWSSGPLAGAAGGTSFFNRVDGLLPDPLANLPNFSSLLDQFSASLHMTTLPTPTKPTGLDAARSFSTPGQNMVTVLNRVEVTFKAQFAELDAMHTSLTEEQGAAGKLAALSASTSSDADVKAALADFVASYNAGVNRFTPDVAAGGVLEGSWEAERARFATERDINYILNGSEIGLKGGLAALGVNTDPKTGLATVDQAQLDSALARNKANVVAALGAFGSTFATTVATLNAQDHAQQRQMANLDRAVHWIASNKADVQKEFGPGAAATPDEAFAKAAARYDAMAQLIGKS